MFESDEKRCSSCGGCHKDPDYADTLGILDPVRQWMVTPAQRAALADIHHRMTRLMEFETTVRPLRAAYKELWKYCVRHEYADEEVAQMFLKKGPKLKAPMLKAVMHQLCCRFLLQAATMPMCTAICCCDCHAAPPNTPCIKQIFQS